MPQLTECDMIGHCYNPDDLDPRECGRCHEMEKEVIAQAVSGGIEHEWQPIESAPRDGTEVLLVCVTGDIGVCYWRTDGKDNQGYWTWGLGHSFFGPTHWMPLPKPPGDLK